MDAMKDKRLRIYVWEFPVRFTHWINFLCILVLSVTGFYIGKPFIHAYSSKQYIMGWMRFVHFIAAYTFVLSLVIRVYWAFTGNRYAGFREWLPFFSKKRFGHLKEGVKFFLFLSRKHTYTAGSTALADFAYFFLFLTFLFESISGFAIYSVNHSGIIWTVLGGWLVGVMSLQTIRLYHHIFMYLILVFAGLHVYISWQVSIFEKTGLIDSIFSGYKYLTGKEFKGK